MRNHLLVVALAAVFVTAGAGAGAGIAKDVMLSGPGLASDPSTHTLLPGALGPGFPLAIPIASDFEDISATGTALGKCDDCNYAVPIGFDFLWFGTPINTIRVSTNGFIAKSLTSSGCCSGPDLATTSFTDVAAVLWDDFDLRCGSSSLKYQTVGSAPLRKLIVQWTDADHYYCFGTGSNFKATFQVKLYETLGFVEMQYLDTDLDSSMHTIGIKDGAGNYNQFYRGNGPNPAENAGVLFVG